MATKVEAARLLTLKAARMKDAGERSDLEAGMAKLFASETGKEVVEESFRIHGGYGYSKEYEIERLYRDAPLLLIGEGTSEIQRMVIGKKLLRAEQDLSVPVALVTGANRGIGAEIARQLAARSRLPRLRRRARSGRGRAADGDRAGRARRHRPGRRSTRRCERIEPDPGRARRAGQQRRRLRRSDRRRRLRPRPRPTRCSRSTLFGPWRLIQALAAAAARAATRRGSSTSPAAPASSPT